MATLVEHARTELERAGFFKEDGAYDGMIGPAVMVMIEDFAKEGHSGMSASICSGLFDKLSRYKPLGPLTGERDEWNETSRGVLQNKRCSHVFKEGTRAYDIQGTVFRERNGGCFTGYGSRTYVTFPYQPKSKTVPAFLNRFYRLRNRILGRMYS